MVSCDANKGKVSDLAEKFVKAIGENDKVTIYELYPSLRNMDVLTIPTTLPNDIDVEFNENDSVYVAKLDDEKSLIVKVYGEDKLQIIDSYKVFKLDSLTYELAAKVGAPVNSMSDIWNGKYFNNDGHFINWLEYNSKKILTTDNGRYTWRGGRYCDCKINERITNNTKHSFEYGEYSIEYEFKNRKTGEKVGTHTEPGPSLAPGESQTIYFWKDELYYIASKSNLMWGSGKIVFKDKNKAHSFAKYGEFNGDEYNRHINRVGIGVSWDWAEYDDKWIDKAKELGITEGLLLTDIWQNSPAEGYGLKQWDVIIEIDGQSVKTPKEYTSWSANKKKGDNAKIKIIRNKKEEILSVVLTNAGDTIPN